MARGVEQPIVVKPEVRTPTGASDAFVQNIALTPIQIAVLEGASGAIAYGLLGGTAAVTGGIALEGAAAVALGLKIGAILGTPGGALGMAIGGVLGAAVGGTIGGIVRAKTGYEAAKFRASQLARTS